MEEGGRTRPLVLIVALIAVLTVAGCSETVAGKGVTDGGTASSGAPQSHPSSQAPHAVAGTLTFWDTSDPSSEAPAFKELISRFEQAYPRVSIKYVDTPVSVALVKFLTASRAGTAPDIFRADVAWVSQFASLGFLAKLDGTSLTHDESDFLAVPEESTQYQGHRYAVPQTANSLALLYNKNLFRKAGITEPPRTWAQVITAARTLKAKTGVPGIYLNPAAYWLLPFIYGEGGNLVNASARKITIDDDKAVAGLQQAVNLIKSGAAPKPLPATGYTEMTQRFATGKVGMIIDGPWELSNIRTSPGFGGADNLGIAPVPAGSSRSAAPVGGQDYVVSSRISQSKTAAVTAFVDFMSSAQSQAFLAGRLGQPPARKSAYNLPGVRDNATMSAFRPIIEAGVPGPWIPQGGQLYSPLDTAAVEILVDGKSPRAALAQVAREYRSILPGWG